MGDVDVVMMCEELFGFEGMAEFDFEVQLLNKRGSPLVEQFEEIEVGVVESFDQVVADNC